MLPLLCHSLPIGSCPTRVHEVIKLVLAVAQSKVPNMDGLRHPLPYCSFDPNVWGPALGTYFDARELLAAMVFGWDQSFTSNPNPFDA